MTSADEDWLRAAMNDDSVVVELLLRLHTSPLKPPPPPPLEWNVRRQRRSRPVTSNNAKKPESTRDSPTTPLSWSGGATSISGGAEEESSRSPPRVKLSGNVRSKIADNSERSTSKKSRKKKTSAELKEEESLLYRERRELKRGITALRANLEKQRATNESLKRIKLELLPLPDRGMAVLSQSTNPCQFQLKISASEHVPSTKSPSVISDYNVMLPPSTTNRCLEKNAVAEHEAKFVLPDLNMPFEEESISDVS